MSEIEDIPERSARITQRDVYDRLGRLETKLDVLDERVTQQAARHIAGTTGHAEAIKDHELRLRIVEAGLARNAWLPTLATAVLTSGLVAVIVANIT